MRSLFVIAIAVLAGTAARAETFSFVIEGQAIHIGIENGCNDLSCISIDVPGYYSRSGVSSGARRASRTQAPKHRDARRGKAKPVAAVASPEPASKSAMVQDPKPAPATRGIAPMPVPAASQAPEPKVAAEPKPAAEPAPAPAATDKAETQPAVPQPANERPAVAKDDKPTVVAALPPAQQDGEQAAKPAPAMPIGMWSGSDGQLRIEPCGQYLCGYAAGGRQAGKMVLINMRPGKSNQWVGRVRDFQSGGVYSATMTMRGANSLRIQGCAFGGMICGGRTLARVD